MAFKVNNIIKLSNGRIFNLLEDDLTTQDYRAIVAGTIVAGTGTWV